MIKSRSTLLRGIATPRFYSTVIKQLSSLSEGASEEFIEKLNDLPQVSGSGPFPEAPKFEAVGKSSSLVHISIPASASVYMRKGSIVALNGADPSDVSSLTGITGGSLKDIAKGDPVIYQKVTSVTPLSLIVSSITAGSPDSKVTVLNVSSDKPWIIAQRKAILGWTSSTLKVETSKLHKLWGTVKTAGQGQLALTGQGELYSIKVEEGEQISINPTNLLAYDAGKGSVSFVKLPQSQLTLELPALPGRITTALRPISQNKYVKKVLVFWRWIFGRENLYFQVSGPKTLILQTQSSNLRTILTSPEIKDIVSKF